MSFIFYLYILLVVGLFLEATPINTFMLLGGLLYILQIGCNGIYMYVFEEA